MTADNHIAPCLLAVERARQALHAARGAAAEQGMTTDAAGATALWCARRRPALTSMLCAVIPKSERGSVDLQGLIGPLLDKIRPDGAILRVLSAEPPRRRLQRLGGHLLWSLGTVDVREFLPLPADFDAFLAGLGNNVRRQMRASIRAAAQQGFHYDFSAGGPLNVTDEMRAMADANLPRPLSVDLLRDSIAHAAAQDRPFLSVLRYEDGRPLSLICGYIDDGVAILVCQLNPGPAAKIGRSGPSLLHRALLIRALLAEGIRGLIMVNGCIGLLRRYCRPAVAQTYLALSLNPLAWARCAARALSQRQLWHFLKGDVRS